MRGTIIYIAFVLIFSHLLLEASEIAERLWPHLRNVYIKPIISSSFAPEWYVKNGINYLWWIKYNCDDIVWVITYMMLTSVALKYSERLFIVCMLFFFYHVLDYIMLWWNWKSSHWVYWILNGIIIVSVVLILTPIKNKQAIIKQF